MRICEVLLDYRGTKIKKWHHASLAGKRLQATRIEDANKDELYTRQLNISTNKLDFCINPGTGVNSPGYTQWKYYLIYKDGNSSPPRVHDHNPKNDTITQPNLVAKLFQVLSEDRFFLLSLAPLPTLDIKEKSTFVSEYQQILHNTYRCFVDGNRLSDSAILAPFEDGRPRWKHTGNKQGLRMVMSTYACTEYFCSHA